jgi:uncharacterized protein
MSKPFAIVTGASAGIGFELAAICAGEGFDLIIAADRPEIHTAGDRFRRLGADVSVVDADLATTSGSKNMLQSAIANVTPASVLAEQHRKMAEPGSAGKDA